MSPSSSSSSSTRPRSSRSCSNCCALHPLSIEQKLSGLKVHPETSCTHSLLLELCKLLSEKLWWAVAKSATFRSSSMHLAVSNLHPSQDFSQLSFKNGCFDVRTMNAFNIALMTSTPARVRMRSYQITITFSLTLAIRTKFSKIKLYLLQSLWH